MSLIIAELAESSSYVTEQCIISSTLAEAAEQVVDVLETLVSIY